MSGNMAATHRPFPGPGLDHFMPDLEVVEPDWVHIARPDQAHDGPVDQAALETAIVDNLMLIHDPEIPINIHDLGLIYGIAVDAEGRVEVTMTLTAPNCPVAGSLPAMVERGVRNVPGVRDCTVTLTWDPPWTPERASKDAQLALGYGF